MRLTSLRVTNFMRIRFAEINPDGSLVIIGGENAQGKSAFLSAIPALIGGKKFCPDDPIRHGAKSAKIEGDIGDPKYNLHAVRVFTKTGTTLTVTDTTGKIRRAQEMLTALVGDLSFEPLGFAAMDPKEQAEAFRAAFGLDFSELDAERAAIYEARTEENREAKSLGERADGIEIHGDVPEAPVNLDDLMAESTAITEHNAQEAGMELRVRNVATQHKQAMDTVAHTDSEIETTKKRLAELQEVRGQWLADVEEKAEALDTVTAELQAFEPKDNTAIATAMTDAIAANERYQEAARRVGLEAQRDAHEKAAEELTAKIDAIDDAKTDHIAKADHGIEGLAVTEDGIALNGAPLEQSSSAEVLRVAVAVGVAGKPKLAIFLVRNAPYLDEDTKRMLGNAAMEAGAEVWIEQGGQGEDCALILEDGAVKGE